MIVERIDLINFKKYTKEAIEFGRGTIGIFGPNGAGKSTLFDAICWCLYGVTPTIGKEGENVKQEELIQDGKEDMGVELLFNYGHQRYNVSRFYSTIDGTHARVRVDGEIVANSSKEVSSFITKTLGLDAKAFISASFIRQKEIDLLTSQRASKRKEIINRLFNLQLYDSMLDDTKRLSRELDMEKSLLEEKYSNLKQEVKHFKELIKDDSSQKRTYKEIKKRCSECLLSFSKEKKALVSVEQAFEQYNYHLNEFRVIEVKEKEYLQRLGEMQAELEEVIESKSILGKIEEKLGKLLPFKHEVERLTPIRDTYRALAFHIEELNRSKETSINNHKNSVELKTAQLSKLKDKENRLSKEHDTLEKLLINKEKSLPDVDLLECSLKEYRTELEKIEDRISGDRAAIERINTIIDRLRKEGATYTSLEHKSRCPTCHQNLDDNQKALLLKDNTSSLEKYTSMLRNNMTKTKKIEAMRNDHRQRITSLELAIPDGRKQILTLSKKHSELENQMMRLKEVRLRITDISAEITLQEAEQTDSLKKIEKEAKSSRKKLQDMNFDQSVYEVAQAKAREYATFHAKRDALSKQASKENSIREQIEKMRALLSEIAILKKEHSFHIQKNEISKQMVEEAKARVSVIEQELSSIKVEEAKIMQQIENNDIIRLRMNTTKESIIECELTLEKTKKKMHDYEILKNAFKNIPINIHERLKPLIQSEVSALLNETTLGKYSAVTIDEDYTIRVLYNGVYYPIYRFSGGEKDLINLCLRVGISRVLVSLSKEQGFAHLESLFLDETFSSLDVERRRNLLAAIHTLEKFFSQIVIITHVEDIQEMIPAALVVEENIDGSSSITYLKK